MTMANSPMVAALQRLSGREMLINAETADEFVANLTRFASTERTEAAALEVTSRESLCMAYGIDDRPEGDGRKPFVYQDGIAVIPVHGALINRFNSSWGFVTGYNFLRRQLNLVLDDEDVDSFIFDVNTPGGEASGCFEFAREVIASRRVKPSLSMVDSLMASGGMAIGGSTTKVYAIPSARIGSIGVYRQHISIEGALKDAGVKITFAQAGEHKTDGQPYKDLPDSVLKDWTQDVNKTWDDFIALVAEARGMSEGDVRDTQARIYRADEALALGLINAVKTTTEAVPAFVAEMAEDQPDDDEEDDDMDNGKKTEATSAVDYDRIAGMIGTAITGFAAAQNRATAIREHGKEKGQVALASKLAANDKITEAEAIEMIDAAAVAAKPAAPKAGAPKGKAKLTVVGDGDEDEDDAEDADEGDEGDEDEGDEDEADQARAARQGRGKVKGNRSRDNVNHLDRAMSGKGSGVGAGKGDDGAGLKGDAAATDSLLGDYAMMTGTDLRKKA